MLKALFAEENPMHDLYSLLSIALFASPVVVGFAAWFGIWFNEEFFSEPLYDYDAD